ncbi:fungal peroxidase [Mycena rebaudengoi]|nr:fungal peroxidase [Mycena rebaudengoi]
MRLLTPSFVFLALLGNLVSAGALNEVTSSAAAPRSILIAPAGFPDLPTVPAARKAASAVGLNLEDIQGDILIGMRKKKELFFFFGITNVTEFKSKLAADIHPLITSTTQILPGVTPPQTALNIAFSQSGLTALNVTDSLQDAVFPGGQFKDSSNLGDPPGSPNWVPEFKGTEIHGVLLLASDTVENIDSQLASLKSALGSSIREIYSLQGAARPDDQEGHEHFGFLDGISNPSVEGFTANPLPGQWPAKAGHILLGEDGDTVTGRPAWAKDGSFLVFRQLKQLVPEFHKFLKDNPIRLPGLNDSQGSDLLGARIIGRWPSGAPVLLAPRMDDPELARNNMTNNNFTFAAPGQSQSDLTDQDKCPLSAHIRKTRPRADLGLPEQEPRHLPLMRAGIPYGPEVTDEETASNKTSVERGLAFVAYQSNIETQFRFIQQTWADNEFFRVPGVGVDPIIGRATNSAENSPRTIGGLDPNNSSLPTILDTDFVVSRGGEYFFSPSLSAILTQLAV